jgi:collagenase-like PrtC family protease
LPLTFSARCYSARAQGLSKNDCQLVCFHEPDGMLMNTLDGDGFATINGIQIMSQQPYTVIDRLTDLAGFGVHILRLSPQASGMRELIRHFRAVLDGGEDARDALEAMSGGKPVGDVFCNGYFQGRQGRVWLDT